jgi:hypothetical protein
MHAISDTNKYGLPQTVEIHRLVIDVVIDHMLEVQYNGKQMSHRSSHLLCYNVPFVSPLLKSIPEQKVKTRHFLNSRQRVAFVKMLVNANEEQNFTQVPYIYMES